MVITLKTNSSSKLLLFSDEVYFFTSYIWAESFQFYSFIPSGHHTFENIILSSLQNQPHHHYLLISNFDDGVVPPLWGLGKVVRGSSVSDKGKRVVLLLLKRERSVSSVGHYKTCWHRRQVTVSLEYPEGWVYALAYLVFKMEKCYCNGVRKSENRCEISHTILCKTPHSCLWSPIGLNFWWENWGYPNSQNQQPPSHADTEGRASSSLANCYRWDSHNTMMMVMVIPTGWLGKGWEKAPSIPLPCQGLDCLAALSLWD